MNAKAPRTPQVSGCFRVTMLDMVKNTPSSQNALSNLATPLDHEEEAELDRAASVPGPPPVPSGITGAWFPALVVLPGQRHQLPSKVRVYATPEGLYVYDRVPVDQAQTQETTPLWYAPITYPETTQPPANYSAQAANGFGISTTKGTVMVTVPKGCPVCGVQAMAVWQPVWAHSQVAAEWKAG